MPTLAVAAVAAPTSNSDSDGDCNILNLSYPSNPHVWDICIVANL